VSAKSDYADLVAQAERAVAAVKDPELKRAAFERVLEDLLAKRTGAASLSKATPRKATSAKPATAAGKPAKQKSGPQAYVEELVADGFFKKPKTITQVKAELQNRGHHIPLTSLSGPLQKLCQRRVLRRQKGTTKDTKHTFNYSHW
jgi:hypothetical protein